MTRRAVLDGAFRRVIAVTAEKLAPLGFACRGFVLRILGESNSGVVEFQKSIKSSSEKICFTINVAVVCGVLLELRQPAVEKAGSIHGHIRKRIGAFLPERPDKWWEITGCTNAAALAEEVSSLILAEAAPYVQRYLETDSIVALWESGRCPGLTETQRLMYLERLGRTN